jgi:transposase
MVSVPKNKRICQGSQKLSNGRRKGSGNTKNGNKYLSWAFVEAANFAIRFSPKVRSFYQRKKAKSDPWWLSKRWRTSCVGPVTTS